MGRFRPVLLGRGKRSRTCDPGHLAGIHIHYQEGLETTQATVHESRKNRGHSSGPGGQSPPTRAASGGCRLHRRRSAHQQPEQFGISLVGPGRVDVSWQARMEGAYDRYRFAIDWEQKKVRCPQGNQSQVWREGPDRYGPRILITYDADYCRTCPARSLCTRAKDHPRRLRIQPRPSMRPCRLPATTNSGGW